MEGSSRLSKLGEISANFPLNEISANFPLNVTVQYHNIVQFEISEFLNMIFKQQNTSVNVLSQNMP